MDPFPTLRTITIREVQLPLVHPFRTSFGNATTKHAILVEIEDEDGNVGWGETTVEATPGYCYETVDTAWPMQTKFLIPKLKELNSDQFDIDALHKKWAPVRGHEFAKGGIEAALLALLAESQNKSLGDIYGSTKDKIPTGVSIGIQTDISKLLDRISTFIDQGYRRIKIKIEPGWDVEPVRAIREKFGDILLMVDANSAYTLDDIAILKQLDEFGLMMIEQPLAYNDILQHKFLQDELQTPVCLDESIHNPKDAKLAIDHGSCKIINIKPGRVGGYYNAIKIAEEVGVGAVWCGGMLETGIGRLHNIFLQARDEFSIPGDTSGSDRYFANDVINPAVRVDDQGYIAVPKGRGLGYEVNTDQVDAYTIQAMSYRL
ncbi:MAG: o-succinylbenzoate synthase [Candidatus Kariarchaeaceae archaeon]|jgi:O-succinylbenzoate synthase